MLKGIVILFIGVLFGALLTTGGIAWAAASLAELILYAFLAFMALAVVSRLVQKT